MNFISLIRIIMEVINGSYICQEHTKMINKRDIFLKNIGDLLAIRKIYLLVWLKMLKIEKYMYN